MNWLKGSKPLENQERADAIVRTIINNNHNTAFEKKWTNRKNGKI